jgi:hypothetical protein
MKHMRRNLITFGILAVVLLAGCFNSAGSLDFSQEERPATGSEVPMGYEPFTVTIYLGTGGEGRSIAGPDDARIRGTHIRNFIQVFLVDIGTNKVIEIFEHRRTGDLDTGGTVVLSNVEVGKTYSILMLQGHWERNYSASASDYEYNEAKAPTLLSVGLISDLTIKEGINKVPLTIYPIWVDTKFTSSTTEVEPNLGSSPKTELASGIWRVEWTVKRGAGENGFTDLKAAQIGSGALFKGLGSRVWLKDSGVQETPPTPSITENRISLNIGQYTNVTETEGSANFNITYVPFSLFSTADVQKWTVKTAYFSSTPFNGIPEWIIRNGVNDAAQNSNTTFAAGSMWNGTTANGNGAVAFRVTRWDGTGRFVAVAQHSDKAAWSNAGGKTWTAVTLPSNAQWISVAYGDGVFVTVAWSSDKAAWSADGGKTWTTATLPSDTYWHALAYGNGVFVTAAYNSSKAAWSADGGKTWTEAALPVSGNWNTMAYGNGVFVTVEIGTKQAVWSPDGKTWTTAALPWSNSWYSVAYGNGMFVTAAAHSNTIAWSPDGKTWTEATTLPNGGNDYWYSLGYGGGVFVLVSSLGNNKAAWSPDGTTWTLAALPSSGNWRGVAYGGDMFVTLNYNSNQAAWSADKGKTWTLEATLPSSANWHGVAYGEQ